MSYNYYGVDPARTYYIPTQPPPPGYPVNGYPPAPQSPTAAPPARPHTTAPFPSPSQYGPPGAVYYGPPQQNGHPPPAPAAAPPPPSAAGYPPQTPAAPAPPPPPGAAFGDMSPEQLQGMIDQLKNLKMSKSSPAPSPPAVPVGHNGHPSHSPPPRINTSMPPPPPGPHGVPQSARGHHPTPSQSTQYPPYPYSYHKPASHSGELSPSAPPPQGYAPSQPKAPGPMPGSFFPDQAPPHAPSAPKTPAPPQGRPEPARKVSEQTSETSFESGKSHDLHQAYDQWGGKLVEISQGREPRPKPKLIALFRGIAAYMIALLEPTQSCVVTLGKLIQFYHTFPVSENEAGEWRAFFNNRSPKSLSELFCALNVEHHLVPIKPNQAPTLPGLTPRGFEVWMFTQLMAAPEREWLRISRILEHWTIFDQGHEMPKLIPRKCFPQNEDRAIYQGWWQAVREDYPEDSFDSDEERKVPLSLPEPGRRRGYSIRGGDLPHAHESINEDDSKDSPPPAPPSLTRQRTSRPYSTKEIPDPRDFLTPDEKESSPTERFRQPYGSTAPNPQWKEDVRRDDINPRPTLGEEPVRPPTRSRSVKTSKTPVSKEPLSSSRRATKRGRSAHRKREESPDARYNSDDEYDEAKYDGYGKRYEGDGLYESLHVIGYGAALSRAPKTLAAANSWALSRYEEPPLNSSHHYHHPREPSRGPPKSRAPPPPPPLEKDIREYTYQDQYEREKEYVPPTVNAGGRRLHRERGGDPHGGGRDRKSGPWR